jgi:chemotaxis signal transduction protein
MTGESKCETPGFSISFRGEEFTIPNGTLRQLAQGVRVHRLPGRSETLHGLAAVRGEILPVSHWRLLREDGPIPPPQTAINPKMPLFTDLVVVENAKAIKLAIPVDQDPVAAVCDASDLRRTAMIEERMQPRSTRTAEEHAYAQMNRAANRSILGRDQAPLRGQLMLRAGGCRVITGFDSLVGFSDGHRLSFARPAFPGLCALTTYRGRAFPVIALGSLLNAAHEPIDPRKSILAYVSLGPVGLALAVEEIEVVAKGAVSAQADPPLELSCISLPAWILQSRVSDDLYSIKHVEDQSTLSERTAAGLDSSLQKSSRTCDLRGRALEFEVLTSTGSLLCSVGIAHVLRIVRSKRTVRLPVRGAARDSRWKLRDNGGQVQGCARPGNYGGCSLIEERGRALPCLDGTLIGRYESTPLQAGRGNNGYDLVLAGPKGEFALRIHAVLGLADYGEEFARLGDTDSGKELLVVNRYGRVCVVLGISGISCLAEGALM